MLIPLNAFYWGAPEITLASGLDTFINLFAPSALTGILCVLSFRVLKAQPASIWTATFWFPAGAAAFFGFGPLVEILGNDITRATLSISNLAVSPDELFRANELSTAGITLIIAGFWLYLRLRVRGWETLRKSPSLPTFSPVLVGVGFVAVGAGLKYLLFKPAEWGEFHVVIPGTVTGLDSLTDVGFGIVAFLSARGNKLMRGFFLATWPIHLFLCVLSLAKVEIITAMLLPLIGAYVGRPRMGRFLAGVALIAVVYMAAEPWVHYGREIIYERTGSISLAGYVERSEIFEDYVFSGEVQTRSPAEGQDQGWWTRLSYAGGEAYAMALHDQGIVNHSLDDLWIYFIPRVVWPDKPVLHGPSLDFYRQVSGDPNGQSYLGLAIYGDLYWQFGWAGILFACPLIGWLFGSMAARATRAIENREFIMLPAVLMALKMALIGPTDFVVTGIIGGLPIYFGYVIVLRLVGMFVKGTPQKRTGINALAMTSRRAVARQRASQQIAVDQS
jgi:hypothetical protein